MRIGQLTQWYDPDGSFSELLGVICISLSLRGHSVDVPTGYPNLDCRLFDDYDVRPHFRENHGIVTFHRALLWANHDQNGLPKAPNFLTLVGVATTAGVSCFARTEATVVHPTPAMALPAMAIKRLYGVPFVGYVQDLWSDTVLNSDFLNGGYAGIERAFHAMCDQIARRASSIAVTSPGMMGSVLEPGMPKGKMGFVPDYTDESVFKSTIAGCESTQKRLGPGAPFIVLCAGTLDGYQHVDPLIDIAKHFMDDPYIQFAFVTSGIAEGRPKAQSRQVENISFVPPQSFESKVAVLSIGDVHCITLDRLPLFEKTIPSKIQAILAACRPGIDVTRCDAQTIFEDAGSSVVARPQPAAVASAIRGCALMSTEKLGRRRNSHRTSTYACSAWTRQAIRSSNCSRERRRRKHIDQNSDRWIFGLDWLRHGIRGTGMGSPDLRGSRPSVHREERGCPAREDTE